MGKKIEWYLDFVNLEYRPRDEIIALYYFEPREGVSKEEAAGRIASESSVGTWTTLPGMPEERIRKLMAKAFDIDGNFLKVAYPLELWEEESIPQLMTGVAGNIFGMKAVESLKLLDVKLPESYLEGFKGAIYGRDAPQKIFRKRHNLITSTVIKPKVGYTAEEHAEIGFQIMRGGIDCIKDDENLTDQSFNKFEDRVRLMAKVRDKAEEETGEVKDAFINVTAPNLRELERRIKLIHEYGFRYFMIDVVISGFTAVQTATDLAKDYEMAIHAHRAMHAAFTRKNHGISMLVVAKLMKIMGVDQIHIGTVVGKLEGRKEEVVAIKEMLLRRNVDEIPHLRLDQDFHHIKGILPVASGGLHPGILPDVFDIYNLRRDPLVIQVGGGVLGHPDGPYAGAKAVRDAIDAYFDGVSLERKAEESPELRRALEKWGHLKPV